jgi:small subunit ribosomal protein S14
MATKAWVNRMKKRDKMARKYAARRAELKRKAKDVSLTPEERMSAREQLALLPRNSSPVRKTRRCIVSGRRRGVYREFLLSRIAFRDLALQGQLPGIMKASW